MYGPSHPVSIDQHIQKYRISPDEPFEDMCFRIANTLARVPARRDHAALLEEMLAGFRQDDAAVEERDEPPVGEEAAGPAPDEAGGADDT